MPQAATKTRPPASSPAAAEVERITKAITDLRGRGAGADPVLLATLESEREKALRLLRAADLEAAEQTAAAGAPISRKTIEKIRRQRRKVHDLHPALLARVSEHRRLRERKHSLETQITTATNTGAFKQAQKDNKSRFVWGRKDQEHPEPPSNEKMPPSIEALARLERDLATIAAELQIAVTVQAEAQARWESEKRTLDAWEAAIRALGPAARQALANIPNPSDADHSNYTGWPDVSVRPYPATPAHAA